MPMVVKLSWGGISGQCYKYLISVGVDHLLCLEVVAVQYNEECTDLYIGQTKQLLQKHNTGELSPQDKSRQCTSICRVKDAPLRTAIHILDRGLKKAIYVKLLCLKEPKRSPFAFCHPVLLP